MRVIFIIFLLLSQGIFAKEHRLPLSTQIVDAHAHYVNYEQHSEGFKSLLAELDKAHVQQIVIMGLPLIYPIYNSKYYYWYGLTDLIVAQAILNQVPASQRWRIHPFITGIDPTDHHNIDHIKRMIQTFPDLWEGIGEIITRHNRLSQQTLGETARANHSALDKIYKFAAKYNMPVLLHSDIGKMTNNPLPTLAEQTAYLSELEEALTAHPKTKIILAHAGTSIFVNTPDILQIIEQLLNKYNNLWIDISDLPINYMFIDGRPNTELIDLINHFPDKFIIGYDILGMRFTQYSELQKPYLLLQAALPEAVVKKIAYENIISLLPKQKVRLKPEDRLSY